MPRARKEPPAAPPWIYRTAAFETPRGQQDVEDWFAGFRQGAAIARADGYREAARIVPIALPPATSSYSPPAELRPPMLEKLPPATEILPPPHKEAVPPADAKDGGKARR